MKIKSLYREYDTGNWIKTVDNDVDLLECPECGGRVFLDTYLRSIGTKGLNYCPYCGKPMKEADDAKNNN